MLVGAHQIGRTGRGIEALRELASSSNKSSPITVSAMPSTAAGLRPFAASPFFTWMISNSPRRFSRRCVAAPSARRSGASGSGAPSLAVPANGVGVRRRERRVVDRRQRQPAGIDHAARELGVRARAPARRRASAARRRMRRHEIGRAGRVADILVGRLDAFEVVASISARAALPFQHGRKLPGQIVRILNAGIGAARAERRDLMRRIADEDHAAMHEAVEPAAVEGVDRDPFELEGHVR